MAKVSHHHWQQKIAHGKPAAWHEIAIGHDDLAQCIAIIVLTPRLSVPTEPEKFCNALDYIDRPPAIAIPNITREIWDALSRFEPRIILHEVRVEPVAFEHFKAFIEWRPREDVAEDIRQTVVDLRGAD